MNQTFTLGRRDASVPILPLHRSSPSEISLWQRLARLFSCYVAVSDPV